MLRSPLRVRRHGALLICSLGIGLILGGCASGNGVLPASHFQSIFLDKAATDDQLRAAFAASRVPPSVEEGRRWIAIYRDATRSDTCRRLAFLAFADRYFRPGVDLVELAATYGIADWFDGDRFGEWTYSSSTPLDRSFRLGRSDYGIYVVATPEDLRIGRDLPYVCFALSSRVSKEEIRQRIRDGIRSDASATPELDEVDLTIAGVRVNYPEGERLVDGEEDFAP